MGLWAATSYIPWVATLRAGKMSTCIHHATDMQSIERHLEAVLTRVEASRHSLFSSGKN